MDYKFLLELALILFFTKFFGLIMKKIGLPSVVGMLIAGLLLGPAIWSPLTHGHFIPVRANTNMLKILAELGVIMIMFSAGLETDLQELKRSGLISSLVAFMGVLVPLGLGFLAAMPFFGVKDIHSILSCVFIGVIITATSVSITVETLREMGRLKGRVGTTILSAAIIDDVIGIIVLTFIIGLKDPSSTKPYMVLINTALFFILGIGLGLVINLLFKWMSKRYPKHRRVPIFSLVVCFVYAFCAEKLFGIADITGAYLAGIMLSNIKGSQYIDRKIDVSSYMFFTPIFFASIGINTSFSNFKPSILLFSLLFILAGIIGKIGGCGLAALLCRFKFKDSLKVGVGMIARGEVALIVTQKGISKDIIQSVYLTPVILLVIITSLITPIFLKLLYRGETPPDTGGEGRGGEEQLYATASAAETAAETQENNGLTAMPPDFSPEPARPDLTQCLKPRDLTPDNI